MKQSKINLKMKKQLQSGELTEVCTCNHFISEHNNTQVEKGHANCRKCDCPRYTWKAFVKQENKAEGVIASASHSQNPEVKI